MFQTGLGRLYRSVTVDIATFDISMEKSNISSYGHRNFGALLWGLYWFAFIEGR